MHTCASAGSQARCSSILRMMALLILLVLALLASILVLTSAEPVTTVAVTDQAGLGPTFDGVGGNSAGGGTRLLLDYPEQARSDILDLLFKPQFGASLHHLKVEIGSDGDTTEGAEPTHSRNSSDLAFDRGYEVWLLQEAARRRPDIQLSGLLFGVPGWVHNSPGAMWGANSVKYLVEWVTGLQSQKGLNVTALGVAYNERSYSAAFIKTVRKALDSAGFASVKTIAPDSWGKMWAIVDEMHKDPELCSAIDIIGTHDPGAVNGHPENDPPPGTMSLGKPLWGTEQHIGEAFGINSLPGGVEADLPIWDWRAGLGLARVLNQGYITANQTATLIWTPTWSWSEYIWYAGKGLLVANTPWSGHYAVPDALWLVAHTTQAVQPGWRFTNGQGTRLLADSLGSVVSYVSPDSTDVSIVVETANSKTNNTLQLRLSGAFAALPSLHVWRSIAGDVFKQQPALQLRGGAATLPIPPGAVFTLTTVTGLQKGVDSLTVPPPGNFSLPHVDTFESYKALAMPNFTSDMHGAFTVSPSGPHGGNVLRQRTLLPPDCTHCGGSTNFVTTMGDGAMVDYTLRVSGRVLPSSPAAPYTYLYAASHIGVMREYAPAKVGNLTTEGCSVSKGTGQICQPPMCSVPMCSMGHQGFQPASLHDSLAPPGFVLKLSWNASVWAGARWTVRAGSGGSCAARYGLCPTHVVANGSLPGFEVGSWATLELTAQRGATASENTTLSAAVNGQQLGSWAVPYLPEARGAIAFGNSMHTPVSEWDNLSITPAPRAAAASGRQQIDQD